MNYLDFENVIHSSFKDFGSKLVLTRSKGLEYFNYNCLTESGRGFGINNSGWDDIYVLFLHGEFLNLARAYSDDIKALLKLAFYWVDQEQELSSLEKFGVELFDRISNTNSKHEKEWNRIKNFHFSSNNFYEASSIKSYARFSYLIDCILSHRKTSYLVPELSHYCLHLHSEGRTGSEPCFHIYIDDDNSIKIRSLNFANDPKIVKKTFSSMDKALDAYYDLIMMHEKK